MLRKRSYFFAGLLLVLVGAAVAVLLFARPFAVPNRAVVAEVATPTPSPAAESPARDDSSNPAFKAAPVSLPARQDVRWQTPAPEPAFAAFQKWADEFRALPESERPAALAQGVALARERRAALKSLMVADPERALERAVPASVRRGLPAEVTALLEQPVDGRGNLAVVGVAPGPAGYDGPAVERFAEVNGQRYRAYVFGLREFQPTRTNIALHGIAVDNLLAVDQWPGRVLEPVETEAARAALAGEPVCDISQQPTASTGAEVVLNLGGQVEFFCGPSHATTVLNEAAVRDALIPPGPGARSRQPTIAASGEEGLTMPSFGAVGDASWTTGAKSIVVVRLHFNGYNYLGLDAADCAEIVRRMSDHFELWSYGKYRLRPVGLGSFVTPPFNLPDYATDYTDDDIGSIWNKVIFWAYEQGYGWAGTHYDLLMLLAGDAPIRKANGEGVATWGGMGLIGGGLTINRTGGQDREQSISRNVTTGLHELGHNLGLFHASSRFTTPQPVMAGFSLMGLEYGDRFDQMGWGREWHHFNVRYKQWLHWLSPSEVPSAVSNGRYAIRPHDLGEGWGIRGLKVPFGAQGVFNDSLFVEYRANQPDNPLLQHGVIIRLGKHGAPKTYLHDATPETPNHEPGGDSSGNLDSPLLPGRTYSHTRDGRTVHITNVEVRPGEAVWVEVVQGTPAGNQAPTGSITASSSVLEYGRTSYLTANVTDPDGDDLAYHWIFPGSDGPEPKGPYPNQRTLPFQFFRLGSVPVVCIVSDMRGGVRHLTNTFTVTQDNPPTISAIPDYSTDEDTPLTTAPFTVSDLTRPPSMIQVTASSDNQTLLPNTNILVNHPGDGNCSLTLRPATNRHGQVTVTVNASDGIKTSQQMFTLTVRPVTPGQVYLARGSFWRYRDVLTAPPTNWAAANFDDSSWPSGRARFVFNQGLFLPSFTQLRSETNRVTTYYRNTFTLPGSRSGTPTLKLLCDDGAVVYLNGVEVWRQNLPTNTIGHFTRSRVAVEGPDESQFTIIPLPPAAFQTGTNVLAISVHDVGNDREGWDVSFDAELAFLQSPVLTGPSVLTTPEDTPRSANITASDSESPSGGVVLSGTSSDSTLVADNGIQFGWHSVIPFQRIVTITPMPDAHGTVTITLRASDGSSETWLPIQFTITPVNDPPTIAPLPPVTAPFGEVPPLILVELNDPDSPLESLTLTASSSHFIVPTNGLEVLPGPTPGQRWLRVSPNPSLIAGQSTITLVASDGQLTATNSFVFRVTSPIAPNSMPSLLVRSGESWRYYAGNLPLDDRGQPIDWKNPELDDRNWPQGNSPLGYNYTNLATTVPVLPYRVTTYFRRSFFLASTNGLAQLTLRLLRDDGAAVYLNGQLLTRRNLPASFSENTLASSDVGQATWETVNFPTLGALRSGWNLLAVEVHQSEMPRSGAPGDLIMNLELDALAAPPLAVDTLITLNDQWEYWDSSDYPGANWKAPTFAPDDWKTGVGRFGFGIGGEATLVNGGPTNSRQPTILFRRAFDVSDPALYRSLHLFLQTDDGIQVFLNGTRVFYRNVAPAADETSFALSEVSASEQLVWRHYLLDSSRLLPGRNLLAVSLHQSSSTNTDLAFDLQLTAGLADVRPQLFLRLLPTGQELSWPAAFNGWQLESSATLAPGSWTLVNQPVLRDGPWHYVLRPGLDAPRFFRLRKP